ncbi:MAG: class I SAM-dependent methyltransferase [Hyphomicrobiaceae bacterium]
MADEIKAPAKPEPAAPDRSPTVRFTEMKSKVETSGRGWDQMSEFDKAYHRQSTHMVNKWSNYLPVYERHLGRFQGQRITMLEIGISQGGSLDVWERYFGPAARIVGVDIDKRCTKFARDHIHVEIGSQEDPDFLLYLVRKYGPFDFILDDGGHTMTQQITTFRTLYPHVTSPGVFMTEDTHTSYEAKFGGGLNNPDSFMNYAKQFADWLHGWHVPEVAKLAPSGFLQSTASVHFYDSIVVLEKAPQRRPYMIRRGERTIS